MDTIRAWKDPEYRRSFDSATHAQHPSGVIRLDDDALECVAGGRFSNQLCLPTFLICVGESSIS